MDLPDCMRGGKELFVSNILVRRKTMDRLLKLFHGKYICTSSMFIIFAAVLLAVSPALAKSSNSQKKDESVITTGSGDRYKTTVERSSQGELSAQDLHQASLLASKVVSHINKAAEHLVDMKSDDAQPELEKAKVLCGIIRDLLPVTTVTTVVTNAEGTEVYRDVDKVQDDRIPLYSGMIERKVLEPVEDAKKKEVETNGLRLAEADVVHTSVLVDISYVERKIRRALALLDKPEKALDELGRAQTAGIELSVSEEDTPLVAVQEALRLAERMVEEGKIDAAKDNLQLAQMHLETYRALVGKEAGTKIKKLQDDITEVSAKLHMKEAGAKIRGFWERVVSWFKKGVHEAHTTAPDQQAQKTEK